MSVRVTLEGVNSVDRALRSLEKEFPKQSAQALNRTAGRINTRTRRETSKELQIAQHEIKNRFQVFKASERQRRIRASVWVGTKSGLRYAGLRGAQSLLDGSLKVGRRRFKTFRATMPSGYAGQFMRKPGAKHRTRPDGQRTQLPIEEPRIRLAPIARRILLDHSREQMADFYPDEMRRLARLAINRRIRRKK
jgi:hypothetical protein